MLNVISQVLGHDFEIAAAVRDGKAALDAAEQQKPDVVLLDISMPKLDGFRTAAELKNRKSRAEVVFVTACEDDDYISEALGAGARAYIVKRRLHSDLLRGLNLALAGKFFISPHAFDGVRAYAKDGHTLQFYIDETIFLQRIFELCHTALVNGERVFLFLNYAGVCFVGERLRAAGLDLVAAIARGQYRSFAAETVIPLLVQNNAPNAEHLRTFFQASLLRGVAEAQRSCSQISIFSNVMAPLLNEGWGRQVALRMEQAWNEMLPRDSCVVHCGCPAIHLKLKESRDTLSQICREHNNVIPAEPLCHPPASEKADFIKR